jgi:zinc transporter ZupT
MAFLLASLAVLAVGPASFALAQHWRRALRILDGLVVIAVGGLVVLHIIPETVERAGWVAVAPLVAGLLGPTFVERALVSIERQAHVVLLLLVLFGLGVHALMDGVALALPSVEGGWGGLSLPTAVVLHRIPVSLLIWWLLRPSYGVGVAVGALAVEGIGAIVGFVTAQGLAGHVNSPVISAVQAFVAGSMLHVMVDRRDYGEAHTH